MMNPLLQKFDTPFETAPFDKIKNEHYLPAIREAIRIAKNRVKQITGNTEKPSFENTIEALERSAELLESISAIFFNINSAETSPEVQNIAKEISPLLSDYANDILLDEALFQRIKSVYEQKNKLKLSPEEEMLLEKTYKNFVRNGANLNEVDKEKLREIDKQLAKLSLEFGEHVLAETNAFELEISDKNDLEGLPDNVVETAAMAAKEKGKEGNWIFTLHYPSYIPFVTYAKNRSLREKMFRAFTSKGFKNDENNNKEIVKEIARLRHERANLLGYATHADFVLEERMAKNPQKVGDFLDDLLSHAKPACLDEIKELSEYARKSDEIERLERWDFAYYSEKLKKEKFSIDDEMLKPYFKLENVIQGVFRVANKLFGLQFIENKDIPKYHPEVITYEVKDKQDKFIAVFYADFFPRAGKRDGAWMTSFKGQKIEKGINQRPHISIVCNFTKPTETKPSLLTFNEVTTLFHEFGHALHGMLADCKYESLSGTNVYWDFVELPSQIMENWAYQKEALDLFARHYESGESIPQDLIQKIKDSANFLEGYQTLRQISFGKLDMAWHAQDISQVQNIESLEKDAMKETTVLPEVAGSNFSTSFSHIFQGGYSAGYYSYKWAEVLDADAFDFFLEQGIFNQNVAESFKNNILSKGGSEHPMELYKRFRGKEPSPIALLKRSGLVK